MMGSFPECEVKLCDFEISRVILEGTEVREILGTPDYVGKHLFLRRTFIHFLPISRGMLIRNDQNDKREVTFVLRKLSSQFAQVFFSQRNTLFQNSMESETLQIACLATNLNHTIRI